MGFIFSMAKTVVKIYQVSALKAKSDQMSDNEVVVKIPFGKKSFGMDDQALFAKTTGDWNPIHMDPLAARRTQMGAPIVHGLHAVLQCLDLFASNKENLPLVLKITVNFLKPIYVGDEVSFAIDRETEKRLVLTADVGGVMAASISLTLGAVSVDVSPLAVPKAFKEDFAFERPLEQSFAEIEAAVGLQGSVEINAKASSLFPDVSRWIGGQTVAGLAGLSTLVGMKYPGLHSVFMGFAVFLDNHDTREEVSFSVASVDERFRQLCLQVEGCGFNGEVSALVRRPPVVQPSFQSIAKRVEPNCFQGQRALIIGGSRGLGECAAKILAAGGASVTVTYAVGAAEAQAVVDDIRTNGGCADLMPYDVSQKPKQQLEAMQELPTHVYYFATRSIFTRRTPHFDPILYASFYQFYVEGFYALCQALQEKGAVLNVFYPSSVAVSLGERPRGLTEYAMAKAAGEILCEDIGNLLPGFKAVHHRLPRLATDQTLAGDDIEGPDTLDVLFPLLRELQN